MANDWILSLRLSQPRCATTKTMLLYKCLKYEKMGFKPWTFKWSVE